MKTIWTGMLLAIGWSLGQGLWVWCGRVMCDCLYKEDPEKFGPILERYGLLNKVKVKKDEKPKMKESKPVLGFRA